MCVAYNLAAEVRRSCLSGPARPAQTCWVTAPNGRGSSAAPVNARVHNAYTRAHNYAHVRITRG